ncbi:MAG TPA: hypothetical protein VD833_26080 [Vicinamibacterales bacterium]|nr:hypothetical protein [Vicinamibacterales bacterium]
MNDLSSLLRKGDPAASEGVMSEPDAAAMRALVMSAARLQPEHRLEWRPVAVAATVAIAIAAGVLAGHRVPRTEDAASADAPAVRPPDSPRQLQFSTPGGTRIIWVFDAEFDLKETLP